MNILDPVLDPEAAARLAKTHSGREALAVIEKLQVLLEETRGKVALLEKGCFGPTAAQDGRGVWSAR